MINISESLNYGRFTIREIAMVKLEYIDTIKYEAGRPKGMFLLIDWEQIAGKRIFIFGTGIEAYFSFYYLKKKGMEPECFINNDPGMAGRYICGKLVKMPGEIWGTDDVFIVIAMSKVQYLNEVIWQLKVHKEKDYAVAFMETYHQFVEEGKKDSILQELSLKATNAILCSGKRITDIISSVYNVGPNKASFMVQVMEACWTTAWSHHLLQWFYNKYYQKSINEKTMLEIGPGRGFFSLVVRSINAQIDIEWLMFEMEDQSEVAVTGKYDWWPANQFRTYYGLIEDPGYRIQKKFDIIVMTEVMEHFSANPRVTICKIADMLEEDGELYLSTPNWGHLPIYDTYYDIPDFTSLEAYNEMYIGHSYQYSKNELEQILDECGLKIEKYAVSDNNHHNVLVRHK